MKSRAPFTPADEDTGARESFEDGALYDFEYRRRRSDLNFYRQLARDRMERAGHGPVVDLACGTGRMFVPLLRDGHDVVGVDRAVPMLERAARRLSRLPSARRARGALIRGDLRAIAFRPRFALAVCAFHSIQHLVATDDLLQFLARVRESLLPDGWFAFDILALDAEWMARDPERRWARTIFRHPTTNERLIYTTNHIYDPVRQALHMRVYYQPVDDKGNVAGPERIVRLCHRQLSPDDVATLLDKSGFRLLNAFGGFHGAPLDDLSDEHVYVACPR